MPMTTLLDALLYQFANFLHAIGRALDHWVDPGLANYDGYRRKDQS